MASKSSNFMQVVPGSERCLNGHPVTSKDRTPWGCGEPSCTYYSESKSSEPVNLDTLVEIYDQLNEEWEKAFGPHHGAPSFHAVIERLRAHYALNNGSDRQPTPAAKDCPDCIELTTQSIQYGKVIGYSKNCPLHPALPNSESTKEFKTQFQAATGLWLRDETIPAVQSYITEQKIAELERLEQLDIDYGGSLLQRVRDRIAELKRLNKDTKMERRNNECQ